MQYVISGANNSATMQTNPVKKAVTALGRQKDLAEALGVSQGLISQWCNGIPVPSEHCPAIERATRVTCEELRPDLDWERNDAGAVIAYRVRFFEADATSAARVA